MFTLKSDFKTYWIKDFKPKQGKGIDRHTSNTDKVVIINDRQYPVYLFSYCSEYHYFIYGKNREMILIPENKLNENHTYSYIS